MQIFQPCPLCKDNDDEYNYYKLDKYSDCMITLSKIIDDYPNSDKIIDAKYLIAGSMLAR